MLVCFGLFGLLLYNTVVANEKDRLYNDLIDDFDEMTFPASLRNEDVSRQVSIIQEVLWYIDGSHEKINANADKIPARFAKYSGYNDFRKKRKAAPKVSADQLKRHSDLVFRLASSTYAITWGQLKDDLLMLSTMLNKYQSYLENSNKTQQSRQSGIQPARPIGDHSSVAPYTKCKGPVKPCYSILDQVISEAEEYTPILFDEQLHCRETLTKMGRMRFLESLSLAHPVDVLSYDPGAGHGKVVYLWRVPEDRSPAEMMTSAARIHKSLESKLPTFHTRQMRREFVQTYTGVTDIPPHIMRDIYSELTLDATLCQNTAIQARLRQAILTGDHDIAVDLRSLNPGRPNDTFDVFFAQLEKEIASVTATDERRHSQVQHFSKFISVRDLINQTAKNCPDGTNVPSESTVLFAFVPKNAYVNTAKLFKGRIDLQHKVQTRQLRATHVDEHYCAAIFSYMKQYAVKFRDSCNLICMDDKAKVDFGEPGMAVQTGVRGKKSLVPVAAVLGALDHDVSSKGSLTPSVSLCVDIPEKHDQSFYRGQVYIKLKDSIFEPSTPFRHATELKGLLVYSPKPNLLMYTDGGPDHRSTYVSVKLSLIILFKELDLDILIAARTAPGHSWANPAERIMSLLNIAYQNVAINRDEMNSTYEQILKSCGSMNDIRKKAEKEHGLQEAWLKSVEPIVTLLNERTERVELKGKAFKTSPPSSKQEVEEFELKVRQIIPGILQGKYTQNDVKKVDGYKLFMEKHCREGHYMFQVRKCDDHTCCRPLRSEDLVVPPFLPDPEMNPNDRDHYKPFQDVLGTQTSERDRPSAQVESVAKVAEEQQGCPNKQLVAQNVRRTVMCYECQKPRCIYAKRILTVREERALRRLLEKVQYTCGSVITPDAVCSFTYSHKDEIQALSELYQRKGYKQCEFHIRAPRNNFIELNFTRFFGFRSLSSMTTGNLKTEHIQDYSSDECLPPEIVVKGKYSSDEQIGRICTNSHNLEIPKVFHSKLNVVNITFIWLENHSSGFTVDFVFHHFNSSCVHICDDRVCLSDGQVCNGKFECADQSDEQNCPPLSQSTGASQSSGADVDLIKAFAVIISIVLMPGLFIIICVVSPCPLRSRMWRRHRRGRDRLEHSQLRPESQNSEVVYVPASSPSTSQDKLLEHQISQLREHRVRVRSVQTDSMLDLPPQIPISKDGEEGYIESQKHLRSKIFIDQLMRPPPNKTVHDRESPPPYYSNSASLENLGHPAMRTVRDSNGCQQMKRCYSMSSNNSSTNGHKALQRETLTKTHCRTLSTNSTGGQQADEPPDYSGICSSDCKNVVPSSDTIV